MSTVLVPLAPGFEEIEALTVVDILRRGEVKVVTAGTVDGPITGRSGIAVIADVSMDDVRADKFDMIILPGGMPGTTNLKEDSRVGKVIESILENGKYAAAICAAPTVLHAMGHLEGRNVTSFPGVREKLTGANYSEDRVVVDGNLITSRSAGTAMEFAFRILEILEGKGTADQVNKSVLARL